MRDLAVQDVIADLRDRVGWRWNKFERAIEQRFRPDAPEWTRFVMERETANLVSQLPVGAMEAIEISGTKWSKFGFASYRTAEFPEYDICKAPVGLECCDLVVLEQVLEHVLWPYRAVRNVFSTLRPGGHFLVTTPFLVKQHHAPVDCSRWTELGLKHLLAEGGFPLTTTQTGSWGNRMCARKLMREGPRLIPWLHSLRNEPNYPVVVWALAQKPLSAETYRAE